MRGLQGYSEPMHTGRPVPLPKPEDLFHQLSDGKEFSILDLSHAYQQMPLTENSKEYTKINTHKGLYRYLRMPFGIACAPAKFQKAIDQGLLGLKGVGAYMDDIIVTGATRVPHLLNLEAVLNRFEEQGIRLRADNCHFLQPSVEFLSHRIDKDGVHVSETKVEAIRNCPQPENVIRLQSFLGMVNYHNRYIPNLSSLLQPLPALLQKGEKWMWSAACERAFQLVKKKLSSASVLAFYDPRLPLRVAADASAYGIGAVLTQIMPQGQERPVAFASRTMTFAKRNYSSARSFSYHLCR